MPTYLNAFASKYEKASIESKVYVLKGSFVQDSRTAFGPLFNFVRNWSSKFAPHIESPGLQGDEKLDSEADLQRWAEALPSQVGSTQAWLHLRAALRRFSKPFQCFFLSIFIFSWLSS